MRFSDFGRSLVGLDYKALPVGGDDRIDPVLYDGNPQGKRIHDAQTASHLQAYGGGELSVDWVANCIGLQARLAVGAGYHFERNGKTFHTNKTDDHAPEDGQADLAAVNLFKAPNPWMTYSELMSLTIIDYRLVGNSFWLKYRPDDSGKPLALYRLNPCEVNVLPDSNRLVKGYEYHVKGAQPIIYSPEEVVHFKRPNPHNPYLGLGLISGGPRLLDTELNVVRSLRSFFRRGGQLAGVLETDRQLPPSALRKIKRAWANLYGGPESSGSVAVLERGMKFNPIQGNANQTGYAAISDLTRDRACALLETPVPLVIQTDAINPLVLNAARRHFDQTTMRPMLDSLQERITISLTDAWNYEFVIPYEYKLAPEDALNLAAGFAQLPGVKLGEVREFAGLGRLGDKRDDLVLNLPGENTNRSTIKDRNLPGEAGRPPLPGNTAAFPNPGEPMPPDARVQAPPGKGRTAPPRQGAGT